MLFVLKAKLIDDITLVAVGAWADGQLQNLIGGGKGDLPALHGRTQQRCFLVLVVEVCVLIKGQAITELQLLLEHTTYHHLHF